MRVLPYIFWLSTGLVIYTYAIYPVILIVMASVRQLLGDVQYAMTRGNRRKRLRTHDHMTVSLIFAAYNEESVIAEKMQNCRKLLYPHDRVEILVGCDGCSDRTAE